jgi:hypothetical protein
MAPCFVFKVGMTPLMAATLHNDAESVKLLLRHGASINSTNQVGQRVCARLCLYLCACVRTVCAPPAWRGWCVLQVRLRLHVQRTPTFTRTYTRTHTYTHPHAHAHAHALPPVPHPTTGIVLDPFFVHGPCRVWPQGLRVW